MIKLILFDLCQTLAYRDVDYNATSRILEKTNITISKDKFIKIFEKSTQLKKWKSKYAAYKNLCKNIDLKATSENVNLLIEIRDKAENKTKLYSHVISMLRKLKE